MAQYAYNAITGKLDRIGDGGTGGGDVFGPGSSVGDNIAAFNGDTGTILKDTGVNYINPTFTGNVRSLTRVIAPSDTTAGEGFYFDDGRSALRQIGSGAANFFGGNAGNSGLTGIANTGFGQAAMASLIVGNQNCAYGNASMSNCNNSSGNTAYGYASLGNMTNGNNNCAFGWAALGGDASEFNDCCAFGLQALSECTGDKNSAFGHQAGALIDTGVNNTIMGANALTQLTLGSNNIAIGYQAGFLLTTTDSTNICLGHPGVAGDNNTTRIGNSQTRFFAAGISGATVTGAAVLCASDGQLGTVPSSERYKENIEDMSDDLSIMNLRTIEFNYKRDQSKTKQYGMSAEDVHAKMPYLCLYDNEGRPETVKYHEMPAFLLHEMKKMQAKINELELKLA